MHERSSKRITVVPLPNMEKPIAKLEQSRKSCFIEVSFLACQTILVFNIRIQHTERECILLA